MAAAAAAAAEGGKSSSQKKGRGDNTLAAAIGRMGRGRTTDVGKKNEVRMEVVTDRSHTEHPTIFFGGEEKVNGVLHTHSSVDSPPASSVEVDEIVYTEDAVNGHCPPTSNAEADVISFKEDPVNEVAVNGHWNSPRTSNAEIIGHRIDNSLTKHVNRNTYSEKQINGNALINGWGGPVNGELLKGDSSAVVNGDAYASSTNTHVNGDSGASSDDGEMLAYVRDKPPAKVDGSTVGAPYQPRIVENAVSPMVEEPPAAQNTAPPAQPYEEHAPRVLDKNGKISTQETLNAIKELYEKESDEPFYVDNFGNPLYRSANEDEVNTLRQNRDLLHDHRREIDEYLQEKQRHPELDARQKALLEKSERTFRRHSELRWDADGKELEGERDDNYVPQFLRENR